MAGLKGRITLVTGGAGFIGSHLVKELIDLEAKVIVVDIGIDSRSLYVSDNIYKESTFELIDIRNKDDVFEVFEKYHPEYVFHLAAEPIVSQSFENPSKTFETNIMGTVNVLEACRKLNSIAGIIVASSDKAYGKTKEPYKEDTPLKGDHPYDVSKSSADLISQTYFTTYNLPITITRFGNVYGEGDVHMDRIIPGICEAIIQNKTLDVRSNGKYIRDYIYVKDVVDGYIFLAGKIEKIVGEAYNFSSSDTLSVIELIKITEKIIGKRIKFTIKNTAINEIPYQHLNDTKVRKLGWRPKYSIETRMSHVLDWYGKLI